MIFGLDESGRPRNQEQKTPKAKTMPKSSLQALTFKKKELKTEYFLSSL